MLTNSKLFTILQSSIQEEVQGVDLDFSDLITLFWTLFQMYERFFKSKPTSKKKRKSKNKNKKRKSTLKQ